jgi:hypothetical protein
VPLIAPVPMEMFLSAAKPIPVPPNRPTTKKIDSTHRTRFIFIDPFTLHPPFDVK